MRKPEFYNIHGTNPNHRQAWEAPSPGRRVKHDSGVRWLIAIGVATFILAAVVLACI